MTLEPRNLAEELRKFEQIYSPRIVGRVNDYDIRIAKTKGEHVWHVHDDTDEFFLVLDGELTIALRNGRNERGEPGERVVTLAQGSVFVVPRGVEHRPSAPGGASILMFEPTGTLSVGDRHEDVPDHVDTTVGHAL